MNELVFLKNNQPVTTSLIIADGTGNQHKSIIQLIDDHKAYFERWGKIYFSDLKTTNKFINNPDNNNYSLSRDGRGRPTKVAYLNEQQATFLITLLRNNEVVLDFKSELVDRFYKMRELLLNQQNEQWRAIRAAGKQSNKDMCATIQQVIIPLAREQGSTAPDKVFYMNYQKAVNKAAGIQPNCRNELPIGQLYEVEKLQSMVDVSIRGLAARGADYKQIYRNTNQTLDSYSRLSLIAERFLPA